MQHTVKETKIIMRAKKPQTRRTGGSLALALTPTPKKVSASLIAKQRLSAASKRKTVAVAAVIKKTVKSTVTASKASGVTKSSANPASTKSEVNVVKNDVIVTDKKPKTSGKSKPVTSVDTNSQNVTNKRESNAKKASAGGKQNSKTSNAKSKTSAAAKRDEKANVKSNKELKNLDIQICGFSESESPAPDSGLMIKASISEIVKTKSRAATTSSQGSCTGSPISTPTPVQKASSVVGKATPSAVEANAAEQIAAIAKNESPAVDKTDEKPKKSSAIASDKKKASAKVVVKAAAVDNSTTKKATNKKVRAKKTPTAAAVAAAAVKKDVKAKQAAKKPSSATKKDNKKSKEFSGAEMESKASKRDDEKTLLPQPVHMEANVCGETTGAIKPPISIGKSIEIKADESKSLIDTITDAINEVVKQYQDSAMCEATTSSTALANEPKNTSARTKGAKPKAAGKIAKAPKRKMLSKDTLSAIKGASENLAKEVEKIANVVSIKRPPIKRPPKKSLPKVNAVNDNGQSTDDKVNVLDAISLQRSANESTERCSDWKNAQENQLTTAQKTKTQIAILKKTKKLIRVEECSADAVKGSKMIKIDSKPKKKMVAKPKSVATKTAKVEADRDVSSKKVKIAVRNIETMQAPTTSAKMVVGDENGKLAEDTPKSKTEQKSDDDDNMSLTKLKATLSQAPTAQKKMAKKKSTAKNLMAVTSTVSQIAVKSRLIAPKIKQKYIKKTNLKKAPVKAAGATDNINKFKAEKSSAADGKGKVTKDIYDFHESGHSSEDALSCYKKKKESCVGVSFATCNADKNDAIRGMLNKIESTAAKTKKPNKKLKTIAKKKAPPPPPPPPPQPKKIAKQNDDNEESHVSSDNSDSSYSDGENERQKKLKKKKQLSKRKSTPHNASSNPSTDADDSDDDDEAKKSAESDTSVKTRVNNRRKLAAKNRRLKLYGFYSGPKRHRMASLNALAKVQCLYENESRTAQELGFVKEPRITPKEVRLLTDGPSTSTHGETVIAKNEPPDPKKEKKSKADASESVRVDDEKGEMTSNRTLRNVPGLRGAGLLWEMEDSSMDDVDTDVDEKQVSSIGRFNSFKM